MGYCMRSAGSVFLIEDEEGALAALKSLGNGSNDPRADGGNREERWFSWLNGVNFSEMTTIEDALMGWRFQYDRKNCTLKFVGHKLGQESIAFKAIAPFVMDKSFIKMRGEDGVEWAWFWSGGVLREVSLGRRDE